MPRTPPAPSDPAAGAPPLTRARIRAIAEDLYVLRGYEGFSFGDVAQEVGTTRANIHHHFGNKQRLMAELIERFAADAEARIAHHWTSGDASFAARLEAQLADLRRFYDRFNPTPGARNIWSPVSRLRLDLPVLGEQASRALERVDRAYDVSLRAALARAVAAGEFAPELPVDDVARMLRVTLLSCAPMTQDSGSFAEIEQLFAAIGRTIAAAWGRGRARPPSRRG
jgi:AcrR family transcriptional regulator